MLFEYMDQSKAFVALDIFFPELFVSLLLFGHFGMMLYLLFMLFSLDFFLNHNVT